MFLAGDIGWLQIKIETIILKRLRSRPRPKAKLRLGTYGEAAIDQASWVRLETDGAIPTHCGTAEDQHCGGT